MSYLKKDEASKGFDHGLMVPSDTNLLNGVRRQSTSTLLYSVSDHLPLLQAPLLCFLISTPVLSYQYYDILAAYDIPISTLLS